MFDKTLFDRNAFDRSVSSDGFSITMIGKGDSGYKIVFRSPVSSAVAGSGAFVPAIVAQQRLSNNFSGSGTLSQTQIVLKRNTGAALSGAGKFSSSFIVKTPIFGRMDGASVMGIGNKMFLYQNIKSALSGSGEINARPVISVSFASNMSGSGDSQFRTFSLQLPLLPNMSGNGQIILRRLGALNENVIELIGIDFKPGDIITIDTDLLQVMFGAIEDVSAITSDSVFFELNPGENEITIDVNSEAKMNVTAVWQNRWL